MARLTRTLVLPDAHHPFHSVVNWRAALDYATQFKPDYLVLLGDLGDLYTVSKHRKVPLGVRLQDELDAMGAAFDDLAAVPVPAGRRIYCLGNHENRLENYLLDNAPELHGVVPSIAEHLRLRQRGWQTYPYRKAVCIEGVWYCHDYGSTGKYSIFQSLATAGAPCVFGHTHRLGMIAMSSITGAPQTSMSCGHLVDVGSPAFAYESETKRREWQAGFGIVLTKRSGNAARLIPVPIMGDGTILEG